MRAAEAVLRTTQAATQEMLAAARVAAILAARRAPGLIPSCSAPSGAAVAVDFTVEPDSIRIRAEGEAQPAELLMAVSVAAVTLHGMLDGGTVEAMRLTGIATPKPRGIAMRKDPPAKATPKVLMGEVAAPRAGGGDTRREAFRAFMTRNRLRPTAWAKEAGVHAGEILGYLTGRSRGFPPDVAEKLARAARVRPEDMFK